MSSESLSTSAWAPVFSFFLGELSDTIRGEAPGGLSADDLHKLSSSFLMEKKREVLFLWCQIKTALGEQCVINYNDGVVELKSHPWYERLV